MNAKQKAINTLQSVGSLILTRHIHSWTWDDGRLSLHISLEGTPHEIRQKASHLADLMGARIASISEGDDVCTITFQDFQ